MIFRKVRKFVSYTQFNGERKNSFALVNPTCMFVRDFGIRSRNFPEALMS